MKWKKLFESHILERGYRYYCEGAVENLRVFENTVEAKVSGTQDYEVEISFNNKEEIIDVYCSCPYAESGWNCKHMAAVLFEWIEGKEQYEVVENKDIDDILFRKAYTIEASKKKTEAIQNLVENADITVIKSYLTSILLENEKLLTRFYNMVKPKSKEVNIKNYIRQVDEIVNRYLGRNHFIDYREAHDFISELEEIYAVDVCRMIDNEQYMIAFQLVNYIFAIVGNVDMDDSDGGTGIIAERAYEFWVELLEKVSVEEKREMFQWFITHFDGSIIDYMEDYMENIIMEEFEEEEYISKKLDFTEEMIKKSQKESSEWSKNYYLGKWAICHLNLMEEQKCSREEIEAYCKKYWENSSIRKYYVDLCIEEKNYDLALQVLDESMSLDKKSIGLVSDYSKQKKEIYLIQGNKKAYIKQLKELVLKHQVGNLEVYRELKRQYTEEEWIKQREQIFKKLPPYTRIEQFYEEEKLYDRLLACVLESSGVYVVQQYTKVLKTEYPKQLLQKYQQEVNKLALSARDRKRYQELVAILCRMKEIDGGIKVVEDIVEEWKVLYRSRPAMMDELSRV